MKKLIVAEKPSVARDIGNVVGAKTRGEGYLYGEEYVVTWAIGHLVSLCEPGEVDARYIKWSMVELPMLPEKIPLKVLPNTKQQFGIVKSLMNDARIDSIICATDSAREGELIFRYIYQMAGCQKPVERLWISSMTAEAIRQGFQALKPSSAYDALYESARCRSEADWLVGMNASRAYSLKYNAHLSIGRVQTPTLNLIVKRDKEIEAFSAKDYWEVRADFGDYDGLWQNPEGGETRVYDKEKTEEIKKAVKGKPAEIIESERELKKTPPPQLFDLTTLQREANSKFGFSADKTLKTAQALYEKHKLITYPRTDSRYLSDDMRPKVGKILRSMPAPFAALVADPQMNINTYTKRIYDNAKISDHHAIIPTERIADLRSLAPDEAKLYDMVVRRLIAVHYPSYEYEAAKVITRSEGHLFKSNGSMPVNEGWRALYRDEKKEKKENPLPVLNVGDTRTVEKVSVKACKTKPPQPHNDASILSLMENAGRDIEDEALREQMKSSGLGTPATRAAVIERLITMGYARRSGKNVVSTLKGQQLILVVPEEISSAITTGRWEKALAELTKLSDEAVRRERSERFMQGIRRFSQFLVDAAKSASPSVVFEREERPKHPAKTKN